MRDVGIEEFVTYLATPDYCGSHLRGDARRMWGVLVRICGNRLGVTVPSELEATKTFPLPLQMLKQVTIGHFDGTSTKGATRQTLLKFIEGLH
jgi:hypothetical protein